MNANTEKSTTLAAGQSSTTTIASTAATTNNNNNTQSGNVNNLNGQQPKAQRNPLRGNANRGKSSKSNQVSDTVKNEKLVNGSS